MKDMGNKQSVGKEKDVVSHLRASSTDLSWSYTSRACLLALVVICRKVNYKLQITNSRLGAQVHEKLFHDEIFSDAFHIAQVLPDNRR